MNALKSEKVEAKTYKKLCKKTEVNPLNTFNFFIVFVCRKRSTENSTIAKTNEVRNESTNTFSLL